MSAPCSAGWHYRPRRLCLPGTAPIGSRTTFSAWMLETHRLAEERQFRPAAADIVAGIVLGLVATAVGRWGAGSL